MITSIRAPLTAAEAVPPAAAEPRPAGGAPLGAAGPVAPSILAQAVQQVTPAQAAGAPRLMEARMTAETSAAHAAEAAREAYIKASIAAGISPLPLP